MTFRDTDGTRLDLSSAGRGLQQTASASPSGSAGAPAAPTTAAALAFDWRLAPPNRPSTAPPGPEAQLDIWFDPRWA